ncbi:MAG TPA: phosphodiester glycosidase family protein [bacterium]|nr:phosphodiester glycosidase family protein [bacterium]
MVLCLATGPALAGGPPLWPGVKSSRSWTAPIAPGVQYTHFRVATSSGPLSIHHLRVDLTNPSVRLGMGLAHDQLISPDETVSSMVARTGAVAGVNGDFFDIRDSGMPLNIVVKNGEFLRSPVGRAALAIDKDGAARISHFQWGGSVLFPSTNARYWLAGFNTGVVPEGIVAFSNDRGYGAPVPPPGVRQTVVDLAPVQQQQQEVAHPVFTVTVSGQPEPPAPETAAQSTQYMVGQVWPQQAYYAPFPKGVMLLVGRGNAADWLQQHVTAGMPVEVNLATTPDWRNLHLAIGGGPMLVQNGYPLDDPHSPAPHERDRPNPVLAVGISRDGATMLLVAIDGRQPKLSMGVTQPQLAAYMRWLGAYQAMAFDSGGSVTMVAKFWGRPGPTVVNSPSDGRERPVGNALLIFSSPNAAVSR